MIIWYSTYVNFESTTTVEPRQRISNIYIYLYVSDQSVFIVSETQLSTKFILLINVKMLTIVGILTFISMINTY